MGKSKNKGKGIIHQIEEGNPTTIQGTPPNSNITFEQIEEATEYILKSRSDKPKRVVKMMQYCKGVGGMVSRDKFNLNLCDCPECHGCREISKVFKDVVKAETEKMNFNRRGTNPTGFIFDEVGQCSFGFGNIEKLKNKDGWNFIPLLLSSKRNVKLSEEAKNDLKNPWLDVLAVQPQDQQLCEVVTNKNITLKAIYFEDFGIFYKEDQVTEIGWFSNGENDDELITHWRKL